MQLSHRQSRESVSRPHAWCFSTAAIAWSVAFAIVVGVFSPASSAAEDNQIIFPGGSAGTGAPAAVSAGSSLNTVSLFLGLALAGVGGWFVWRNRRGPAAGRDSRSLAIDETRPLGNRQYLVVASYEGRKFLIGVCPGRINLLSALAPAPTDEVDDE